jgi:hypothetical protein
VRNQYRINSISILAILTNTIQYQYKINASGIEAEPDNSQKETKPDSAVSTPYCDKRLDRSSINLRLFLVELYAFPIESIIVVGELRGQGVVRGTRVTLEILPNILF